MTKNILLTSLSEVDNDLPLRYYCVQNEFGRNYCDAFLDVEAVVKFVLARHRIDEIIVIGARSTYGEEDGKEPFRLGDGRSLYGTERSALSTYRLFKYRIARYTDELAAEEEKWSGQLPEDMKRQLTGFIRDFLEKDPELKDKRLNRMFDELVGSRSATERLKDALLCAFPEAADNPFLYLGWVRNYLYSEFKASSKLGLLSVNEDVSIRFIPKESFKKGENQVDAIMNLNQSIKDGDCDINLYISLGNGEASDGFNLINILDVLVSMPGSRVALKKLYTVHNPFLSLASEIHDDTNGFGITQLVHATRSFLNYGKADLIVDMWEKSGERSESIAAMIYAIRHVDVGLSICNIPEMEEGILRLRELFRGEKLWRELGYYGTLFSVIAESIKADYGTLLEGDGPIPFIDLVKWAYRHQFYQQTLTLIESKAPENLVRSGIFYYCDDESRVDQVIGLLAEERLEMKPYDYYKMEHVDHYFIKIYDRGRARGISAKGRDPHLIYASLRTQSVENTDPSVITGCTACEHIETLKNVLYAYYHIGDVRNKISHADGRAMADHRLIVSESDVSPALVWMKESIDFFIENFEKAEAETRGKKPNVVLITADEVRRAAEFKKNERRSEKARSDSDKAR